MESNNLKKRTIMGLLWSFAERLGVQLVSFVVSILLARLLTPEDYGVVTIVWVFIGFCYVFVERGFSTALVQKEDAEDLDFHTIFWFSLGISVTLYTVLYLAAPWIASLYGMDLLCPVLRVMGVWLILASLSMVQRAWVSRRMEFKTFFLSAVGGTAVSAVVGITMAWKGFGPWALVAQELTYMSMSILIMLFTVRWKPLLQFSMSRMKEMFRYGWKVLCSSLLDTLYENIQSLYVGKLYTVSDLAFYSRGKQFPQLIVDNVNTSINTVLFPAISSVQNEQDSIKALTRRAIKTGSYCMTPLLIGLASVAEPLVELLMTEKWLPCVPFLQILCISYAMVPLQTANQQAIYAMGRSDIVLKLNLLKKAVGLVLILACTPISVTALSWAIVATSLFALLVNVVPNKQLMNYGFWEQLWDILPGWLLSGAMFVAVRSVTLLHLPIVLQLAVMILVGMASYVLLSLVFQVESFHYLWNMVKPLLSRIRKK